MEAHALTPRMVNNIDFPFMVLLASGGHCLLAVANVSQQYPSPVDNNKIEINGFVTGLAIKALDKLLYLAIN
jgi:tRNA N6-adenosine threonylcarbamoyltransferase